MKKNNINNIVARPLICGILLLPLLTGCFMPSNLNFESAKMLDAREVEVQGNGSYYQYINATYDTRPTQLNLGFKLGFGISNTYNLKVKAEYMMQTFDFLNEVEIPINTTFLEVDNKIRLADFAAISLPIGVYIIGNEPMFQIDPRAYFTMEASENVNFTFIPKCHVFFASGGSAGFIPGFSIGAGFSSNINQWAIRPELGVDLMSVSGGISLTFNFGSKKDQ